jgi:hypothetical protein
MSWRYQSLISHTASPLLVDLGYGASPITTVELYERLRPLNNALEVTGLEIDNERVENAQPWARPAITFVRGGFEIPTTRSPLLIRAFNVLRQYDQSEVGDAWTRMQQRLVPEGRIVEGTCDELGRLASWVELDQQTLVSLTLAASTKHLDLVSDIAPRLPKILIHNNIAGEPIHRFLKDADAAWRSHAALRIFGSRQRWAATVRSLRGQWPILTPRSREAHGEITVEWSAIAS